MAEGKFLANMPLDSFQSGMVEKKHWEARNDGPQSLRRDAIIIISHLPLPPSMYCTPRSVGRALSRLGQVRAFPEPVARVRRAESAECRVAMNMYRYNIPPAEPHQPNIRCGFTACDLRLHFAREITVNYSRSLGPIHHFFLFFLKSRIFFLSLRDISFYFIKLKILCKISIAFRNIKGLVSKPRKTYFLENLKKKKTVRYFYFIDSPS